MPDVSPPRGSARAVLPLAWRLTRLGGRRGMQNQLLAITAAAVSALVLLSLLGFGLGSWQRADRAGWLTPAASAEPTALQAATTMYVDGGRPVTVVELAQLPGKAATAAPPGLTGFPRPGQVYYSPALAALIHRLPAASLAGRFPRAARPGTLGKAGLSSPDALIAVIGRAAADPEMTARRGSTQDQSPTAVGIAGYATTASGTLSTNVSWAFLLAGALLIVPITVLAAASGRLGAARREQQLAGLRLAGATPRQILGLASVQSAATGLIGALIGAAAYAALLPLLGSYRVGGGTWFISDLWVGVPWALAVPAAVTLLTVASAVSALRQVVVAPLAAARRQDARGTRRGRAIAFLLILAAGALAQQSGRLDRVGLLALVVLVFLALGIVGPWAVDRLGRLLCRLARGPVLLLAGRRLADDPRAAWRTVNGLALAGLVAGFFSIAQLGGTGQNSSASEIALAVPRASATALVARAEQRLEAAGVHAAVTLNDQDQLLYVDDDQTVLDVQTSAAAGQLDRAVTALTGLTPTGYPTAGAYLGWDDAQSIRDLSSISIAVLVLSFVIAIASAGLTAAATVLDRRGVYRLLRLSGTPLGIIDRARLSETAIPLTVMAGTSTLIGVYAGLRLNAALHTSVDRGTALLLAGCVLLGSAGMLLALGLSRPLLRTVTADPGRRASRRGRARREGRKARAGKAERS
ncbi:hypothetical protein KDK95_31640 [Actinospica sp. MGRD01-02]|uniref:ABC3 transporter permease C-terminal domain-containing protein n=1 Tax=Actinospica acidithermotolerans TaxID=2828514 RepID=A0A941EDV1_9ACTN|nr:FtsX-like permease family protein [Actinospica acidithermotolerans]MBR7830900.1 hypothetical protein [Actinospica acidithermotolerans]